MFPVIIKAKNEEFEANFMFYIFNIIEKLVQVGSVGLENAFYF